VADVVSDAETKQPESAAQMHPGPEVLIPPGGGPEEPLPPDAGPKAAAAGPEAGSIARASTSAGTRRPRRTVVARLGRATIVPARMSLPSLSLTIVLTSTVAHKIAGEKDF
jgi:hypothetical protein